MLLGCIKNFSVGVGPSRKYTLYIMFEDRLILILHEETIEEKAHIYTYNRIYIYLSIFVFLAAIPLDNVSNFISNFYYVLYFHSFLY